MCFGSASCGPSLCRYGFKYWEGIQILRMRRNLGRILRPKSFGVGCMLFSVVSVLIVIAVIVLGEYTKTRGRFLLTAFLLAAYFFTSMAPAWTAEHRPESRVAPIALIASTAAVMILLIGVWGTPNSDAFWKSAAIITTLAIVLSCASVVDAVPGRLFQDFSVKLFGMATLIVCVGIAGGSKWPPYWWTFTLAVLVWVVFVIVSITSSMIRRSQRL